jgi:hypothetical protein
VQAAAEHRQRERAVVGWSVTPLGGPDREWEIMGDLELRYGHLGRRSTPAREARRIQLQAHVAEIQAEQEKRNTALHEIDHSQIPRLRIAIRYAAEAEVSAAVLTPSRPEKETAGNERD